MLAGAHDCSRAILVLIEELLNGCTVRKAHRFLVAVVAKVLELAHRFAGALRELS